MVPIMLEKYVNGGNRNFVKGLAWLRGLDIYVPLLPNHYFVYEEAKGSINEHAGRILHALKKDLPGVRIGYNFEPEDPLGGLYQSFPVGFEQLHWIIVKDYMWPEKTFVQGHEGAHMLDALVSLQLLTSELARYGFYDISKYQEEALADVGGFLAMHKQGASIGFMPCFHGPVHDNVREEMAAKRDRYLSALKSRVEGLIDVHDASQAAAEAVERYYDLARNEDGFAADAATIFYARLFEETGDMRHLEKSMARLRA